MSLNIVTHANSPEGSNPSLTALATAPESDKTPTKELIINGFSVLVDAEGYESLSRLTWSVVWPNSRCKHVYFYTTKQVKGVRVMPRLHRLIAKAQPGQIVDHINGDTLDNRKANLRIVD